MLRIGVTGADGLLGWHTRCVLFGKPATVIAANRSTFENDESLHNFVRQCDAIIHYAGMNRGPEQEIAATNIALAQRLIDSCESAEVKPHIVFASSTHIYRDNAYGKSKIRCSEALSSWAARSGALFTNLVIPHVFGECGRPFYNSAVSTFCHQLATGQATVVENDAELELVHASQVAERAWDCIQNSVSGGVRLEGRKTSVSNVLGELTEMARLYSAETVPDFKDPFTLFLFNTYRSYLYPAGYPRPLIVHSDPRGILFETVRTRHGGQSFVSTTLPGVTRGNHFHLQKFERFLVLHGEGTIRIRKMFSDRIEEFRVSGQKPQYVDIPTLHAHSIQNTGSGDMVTFFWSHQIFDPDNPDTYAEAV